MIVLESVSKTYAQSRVRAVDGLSLQVPNGCIFGFLGPNGAGKTTTIRIMTGALEPDEGIITLDGIRLDEHPEEAKRRFGLVPDTPDLFSKLKAWEFLNFVADVYQVPDDMRKERIATLARKFELEDKLGSTIGSMSRGMRQKLNIIASLVHQPHNWILDEPIVGLDPHAAFALKELMREHAAGGGTVFFSTHVMEVAERLCDQLAIINKGRLMFTGSLEDLRTMREHGKQTAGNEDLESLFLALVEEEDHAS